MKTKATKKRYFSSYEGRGLHLITGGDLGSLLGQAQDLVGWGSLKAITFISGTD